MDAYKDNKMVCIQDILDDEQYLHMHETIREVMKNRTDGIWPYVS